jgi:hypothetical protein
MRQKKLTSKPGTEARTIFQLLQLPVFESLIDIDGKYFCPWHADQL